MITVGVTPNSRRGVLTHLAKQQAEGLVPGSVWLQDFARSRDLRSTSGVPRHRELPPASLEALAAAAVQISPNQEDDRSRDWPHSRGETGGIMGRDARGR